VLTRDARSSSPEQDERVLLHRDESACADPLFRRVARRQLDLPARAEAPRGEREDHRLGVRVEDEQERVAEERLAVWRPLADLTAVEEDAERPRLARPVPLRHPPRPAGTTTRPAIRLAGFAGEEGRVPEDRMLPS
jgi:hypothetical protein